MGVSWGILVPLRMIDHGHGDSLGKGGCFAAEQEGREVPIGPPIVIMLCGNGPVTQKPKHRGLVDVLFVGCFNIELPGCRGILGHRASRAVCVSMAPRLYGRDTH